MWGSIILVLIQSISLFYVENTNDLVAESILLCTTISCGIKFVLFYICSDGFMNLTIYFISYHAAVFGLTLQLLFSPPHERIFKSTALVPFEFAHLPRIYYSIVFLETVGTWLNCILAFALDTYCCAAVGLLSGHIEVLSSKLGLLGMSDERPESAPKCLQLLKYLEHFDLLAEYSEEVNHHLSLVFFVQISSSAQIICACAYELSRIQLLSRPQLMFLLPYSFSMTMEAFTPNYFATNVLESFALLLQEAFSSNWFELEQVEQKALLLFLTRTERPLIIRAGNMYQLNIETFLKITNTAYSLLADLRSTQP